MPTLASPQTLESVDGTEKRNRVQSHILLVVSKSSASNWVKETRNGQIEIHESQLLANTTSSTTSKGNEIFLESFLILFTSQRSGLKEFASG